jgi:hypothetical protein
MNCRGYKADEVSTIGATLTNMTITVFCAVRNAAEYTELFLLSAARYGFQAASNAQLVMLVGESNDGTETVCRSLLRTLPIPTVCIEESKLPTRVRFSLNTILERNDNHFNEGMWDFLLEHYSFDSPYYAGVHVDIEFRQPGLWTYLLNVVMTGNGDIGGIFEGGLVTDHNGSAIVSMPRLLPVVAVVKRDRFLSSRFLWSRQAADYPDASPHVLFNNGANALLTSVRQRAKIIWFKSDWLQRFFQHFGYVWTSNHDPALWHMQGEASRDAV